VSETGADRAYFQNLGNLVPQDPFWVPAEARFESTLMDDEPVSARSSSVGANRYLLPVFPVAREALAFAVESSFAEPYRADRSAMALHLNARSDALEVVFRLRRVLITPSGGQGEMKMLLNLLCQVRYPAPDHREVARIPLQVEVTSLMNEDGTGANGEPGTLWKAAGELARQVAVELQSGKVRDYFQNREAFIERVHSTTGEPAPNDLPGVRFGPDGKHGEYVEVVRLIRR
jgi:hypothetical protein